MTYILAYIATMVAFFAIDILWLGKIAPKFYAGQIGHLMANRPRWGVAALFYAVYIMGIVYYAVGPSIATGDITQAGFAGAIFGFFCYATYDLTNLATLRGWTVKMVVVDIIWGTVLTGSCALLGAWAVGTLV